MSFQPANYSVHLFDIDDTLITTSESYTRAYEKTLRDLTDVSYEELRTALLLFIKIFGSGLPGRIWEAVYKEAASAGKCLKYSPEEAAEQYLDWYMGMLSAYSSVEKYITELKKMNISVGIISNGDYKRQTEKLCAAGLFDLFNPDMIYVSSMFPEIDKKPSPVMIRQWITNTAFSQPLRFIMVTDVKT
ncbi:hypothetical protein CHS0354_035369 [Potamilus streckersoni]|uniref:HAD family hydrolase n=1 Tax=Potamilus streckersoni TaxID=2493646 RepID=A0AAE0S380_9BIVA|nr:hypothetical protein CHS0354_035369 [Potamilus streckersoni]